MNMNSIRMILIILILVSLTSCEPGKNLSKNVPAYSELNDPTLLKAVLWHQTSGEYRALCHQAYNLARLRLLEDLKNDHKSKPAIIADIDETVLDNSAYNATVIIKRIKYPEDFYHWIETSQAIPMPGAVEFYKYASEQGYEIFYITNRRTKGRKGTIRNLQKYGFPFADEQHVFFKEDVSSKEPRRNLIAENHEVVLILGDNLIDFTDVFDGQSLEERNRSVEELSDNFGSKFIIFPNTMHGAWLKALYNYQKGLSTEELLNLEVSKLRTF